ncbi:MAG: hypothetical protein K2N30_05485, partial [Clostridia bacterium]|nr:hypothetical protein [Clostridia bacterium]
VLPLQAVLSFLLSFGFEKALITGFGAGWFALFYNASMLIISDKFNIKLLPRSIAFVLSVAVVAVYVTLQTAYPFDGHKIVVSASNYGGCVLFKSSNGNVLVVTENYSVSKTINTLNKNYSLSLDGVIILGGDDCVNAYDRDLNAKSVYISDEYLPVQPYRDIAFCYENNFELCGINFRFMNGYSLFAECDGISVLICGGNIPSVNCDLLISRFSNYDSENKSYYANAKNTV